MKWLTLLPMLCLVLLLSSCISIEIRQQFNDDGSSNVHIIQDMSGLMSMADGMGSGGMGVDMNETEDRINDFCIQARQENNLNNFECSVNDFVITMKGSLPPQESAFSTSQGTYTLELRQALNSIRIRSGDDGNDSLAFDDESLSESKMMESMGMKYTYVVTMPGPIKSADLGVIEKDTVTINMFDLIGKETVYIVSEGSQSSMLLFIIIGGLILLALIAFFLIKKMKRKPALSELDSKPIPPLHQEPLAPEFAQQTQEPSLVPEQSTPIQTNPSEQRPPQVPPSQF